MTTVGTLDLEEAAKKAAGNWGDFDSFAWHRAADLDDADNWAIFYTHHRDSGLLYQSNGAAIADALESFTEGDAADVIAEHHHHWAVGWIDGFAIRVCRDGEITVAFRTYHELVERLAEYPVLDESDYSNREYQATLENIDLAAWKLKREFDLPDGWESAVFSWFWENKQTAIENRDDEGGWPSEADLEEAFAALAYSREE